MEEVSTRPRKGATTVTVAATAATDLATAPARSKGKESATPVDLESNISEALRITMLAQWLEGARHVCDKVGFWSHHSPTFGAQCDSFQISAPTWEDSESGALVALLQDQEIKLRAVLAHLEGGAA